MSRNTASYFFTGCYSHPKYRIGMTSEEIELHCLWQCSSERKENKEYCYDICLSNCREPNTKK